MFVKEKFKALIERNRWFKSVPNALTLCNSVCGFGAILYTLQAYSSTTREATEIFAISAWIIIFAMVFDALDGFAARIFNAASMKGIQMDSLADMVTFGVAPATLVAIMAHPLNTGMSNTQYLLICGLASVYLGGAALRLATYNVHAMLEKKSSDKFTGLPSPGAASAICSIVIFSADLDSIKYLALALPIYTAVLGLLMVSSFPYTHVAKWLISMRRNRKRLIFFLILILIVVIFKSAGIVALINIYILSGPTMALWNKLKSISKNKSQIS